MKTYFVYITRLWVSGQYQRRIGATQDWSKLELSSRDEIPAIWRVKNCNGSEHAKGRVLMYQVFPGAPINKEGITRIR